MDNFERPPIALDLPWLTCCKFPCLKTSEQIIQFIGGYNVMSGIKQVLNRGVLASIDYENCSDVIEGSMRRMNILEDAYIFDYDKDNKLFINTFTEAVDVVPLEIYHMLISDPYKISALEYNYLFHRYFPYGKSNKKEYINKKTEESIFQSSSRNKILYSFCFSYSCNMRCTYCYQQNYSGIDKRVMTKETLMEILGFIDSRLQDTKNCSPTIPVILELFGGEPLQKRHKELVHIVLDFCQRKELPLAITTNGVEIFEFLSLFSMYREYIIGVNTTIDGIGSFHDNRRVSVRKEKSSDQILKNIDSCLDLRIPISVSMNLDKENISQLEPFIHLMEEKKWAEHPQFRLEIARVDDRLFEIETGYNQYIFKEYELLQETIRIFSRMENRPSNVKLAFLKTLLNLTERLELSFNQNESGRIRYSYCWSTSPVFESYYIDASLDVYRCTYSVARKQFSIGKMNSFDDTAWKDFRLENLEGCMNCRLGGYCSGGCYLSNQVDPRRKCDDELENFNQFIKQIFIPQIKGNVLNRRI